VSIAFSASVVLALMLLSHGTVSATEVKFPSAAPSSMVPTPALRLPASDRPSPAVILLHSGGGVKGDAQWPGYQEWLRRAGFASRPVDS
jgi:hypothetical protein